MVEFVDELPGGPFRARPRTPHRQVNAQARDLLEFSNELRENPLRWGVWPRPLTAQSAGAAVHRQRDATYASLRPAEGFESVARDGKAYVRFNPDKIAADDRQAGFREGYDIGYQRGIETASLAIERGFQYARQEMRKIKGADVIPFPGAVMRGQEHPRAKIIEDDVREIRCRYADGGVTYQQLAEAYGLSVGVISDIVGRRSWAHVE